jgi:hypothetical protein
MSIIPNPAGAPQETVADALRQCANALLSAAGFADEVGAHEVSMTPDEARSFAGALLVAAEMVDDIDEAGA